MRQNDRLRTSVRLLIQRGHVLLRYAGVPAVACTLLDLSEGGCRCAGQFGSLEHQVAEAWERVLEAGRPVQIELSFLPYLNCFPMEAEVRVSRPIQGGGIEVGLKFRNVSPQTAATLNQILLAVATGKVREAFSPEQAAQAAQYLVGARGEPEQAPPPAGAGSGDRMDVHAVPGRPARAPQEPSSPSPAANGPSPAAPARKTEDDEQALEGWGWKSHWENPFRGKRVGEVLIQMGKLQPEQVEATVEAARAAKLQLGRYLLREGLVTPEELCRALALQSGLPMTDLSAVDTVAPLGGVFPFPELAKHEFVPIDVSRAIVCVAAANPLSKAIVGELEAMCRKKVEVFLAQEDLVLRALDRLRPEDREHDRRYNRYFVSLPVSYQFCNRLGRLAEMVSYTGRTVDLSEGGLQIEGPAPNVGQPEDIRRRGLCLRLLISCAPHEVQALCDPRFIKVREKPGPDEFPWVLGLRILEMTTEDRRRLKEICIAVGRQKAEERGAPPPAH